MSEQGDAFVRRVLKADPSPMDFRDAIRYTRQKEGSGRAAAKRLGVPESTLRGWTKDRTPKIGTQQRILEAVRGMRSHPSRLGDAGVVLPVVSRDAKRGRRERDVFANQLKLKAGTLAAAHRVWVKTGDADAAARVFVDGIGDPWYRAQLAKGLNESAGGGGGGAGGGGGGGGGGAEKKVSDTAGGAISSTWNTE